METKLLQWNRFTKEEPKKKNGQDKLNSKPPYLILNQFKVYVRAYQTRVEYHLHIHVTTNQVQSRAFCAHLIAHVHQALTSTTTTIIFSSSSFLLTQAKQPAHQEFAVLPPAHG